MKKLSIFLLGLVVLLSAADPSAAAPRKGKKNKKKQQQDPYAEYVWPAPPDEPRIKLEAVISQRSDVEARSRT